MNEHDIVPVPPVLDAIHRDTQQMGFSMASEPQTGSLLRALAAAQPNGQFLELGTGTGIGTAWLLAGMDAGAQLDSVERDRPARGIIAPNGCHQVWDGRYAAR